MRRTRNCAFAIVFLLISSGGIAFAQSNPCQTTQPVSTLGSVSAAQGTIVYDPNQGVCWLADANLAGDPAMRASLGVAGINPNGSMDFATAQKWVAALNAYGNGSGYLGHNNWQLPVAPLMDRTCADTGTQGGSFGPQCTASAFGNLYSVGLKQTFPASVAPDFAAAVAPLQNMKPSYYWALQNNGGTSGTSNGGQEMFSFANGIQGGTTINDTYYYVLPMVAGAIGSPPSCPTGGAAVAPYTSGPASGQAVYDCSTGYTWLANANLAASNTFGITGDITITYASRTITVPKISGGAMLFQTATQWIQAMNNSPYLGSSAWQMPASSKVLQDLFKDLKMLSGDTRLMWTGSFGPFQNLQPFFYWECQRDQPGNSQSPCTGYAPADGSSQLQWTFDFDYGFQSTSSIIQTYFVMVYYPATTTLVLSPDGLTVYDNVNNISWLANFNLAASNRFGLPLCTASNQQQPCINQSGSMNYASAAAWVQAMNAAAYLGHTNWQLPTNPAVDRNCGKVGPNGDSFGFGCTASALATVYNGLGLKPPNSAVAIPNIPVSPFSNFQPYLYWTLTNNGAQGYATFSFSNGFHGSNTGPNFLFLFPMIQGRIPGTPGPTGTGLQVNPGGQTVYDPQSNVTWLANANIAASNPFGLPMCQNPTTPTLCVAQSGAMTWDSAQQLVANMNSAAYLGQTNWQLPTEDTSCNLYNCTTGTASPMGELYSTQLSLSLGTPVVPTPNVTVGPFNNIQPYLYWACSGAAIQSPCDANGPIINQEWSFSFASGFQGTDILPNEMYATAYYVGPPTSLSHPQIPANAVVNGASFAQGALSPGSIASVFGTGLASTKPNGTILTLNGISAPLYYVGATQINFQAPYELAGQPQATLIVSVDGVPSNSVTANVGNFAPGIFTVTRTDGATNQGAVLLANTSTFAAPTGSIAGATAKPANRGDYVTVFCTGLGPVSSQPKTGVAASDNPLSNTPTSPAVTIGGAPATVAFSGLAPGFFGLYQINVQVPQNIQTGLVNLQVQIGGLNANTVTIAVQ